MNTANHSDDILTASIESLEGWMREMGITWDENAVRLIGPNAFPDRGVMPCTGAALGIVAARDILEGEELCSIPTSACITIHTTSIADIIEAEELGGGLGLVVAVMHEMGQGPNSPWHTYFKSMPHREYIPVFWSEEELDLLQGTDIEECADADQALMKEDWETHVEGLPAAYPSRLLPESFTFDAMQRAASLVASRAFGIDDYHGTGMVPLADAFNHKASVVELASGYAVHTLGEDGARSEEESEDAPNEGNEEGDKMHDVHAGKVNKEGVHAVHGISKANGLNLALEMAIIDVDDMLQVVAASAIPKGKEIHNTYGELGNAELLKKYGFALRQNPFTAVTLDKGDVIGACSSTQGSHHIKTDNCGSVDADSGSRRSKRKRHKTNGINRLISLLEEETDLLLEDEEPFQLLPNGHISPALFAVLRVLCLDQGQSRAIQSVEDALCYPGGSFMSPDGMEPVQIWSVTDESGVLRGVREDGDVGHLPGDPASQMVTVPMCRALEAMVDARLSKYPCVIGETVQALNEIEGTSTCGVLTDAEAAQRGALKLRLTEQEVLHAMKMALNCKLTQLCGP